MSTSSATAGYSSISRENSSSKIVSEFLKYVRPLCLSVCLPVLSVCLSVCQSVPSVCLSVCLSVSSFVCLSVSSSVCLSVYLSITHGKKYLCLLVTVKCVLQVLGTQYMELYSDKEQVVTDKAIAKEFLNEGQTSFFELIFSHL